MSTFGGENEREAAYQAVGGQGVGWQPVLGEPGEKSYWGVNWGGCGVLGLRESSPAESSGVGLAGGGKGGCGCQAGSRDVLGKGRREMQQELCLGRVPAHPWRGVGVGAAPQQSGLSPALLGEEVWELGESSHAWNGSCKAFGGRAGLLEREGDGTKMGFVSPDKEVAKLC